MKIILLGAEQRIDRPAGDIDPPLTQLLTQQRRWRRSMGSSRRARSAPSAPPTIPERGSLVENKLDARGLKILAALDEVSAELQSTPTRVALAWLLAKPSITAPIASATSLSQLDELLASTRLELGASAPAQRRPDSDSRRRPTARSE
jgi:aryl-alcohol dehydrogenase-like predicted oxidoreductase